MQEKYLLDFLKALYTSRSNLDQYKEAIMYITNDVQYDGIPFQEKISAIDRRLKEYWQKINTVKLNNTDPFRGIQSNIMSIYSSSDSRLVSFSVQKWVALINALVDPEGNILTSYTDSVVQYAFTNRLGNRLTVQSIQ